MAVEVITKEDLNEFKRELLTDLLALLTPKISKPQKEWLRSSEVRQMLSISPGTLQSLRINGILKYSKIAGIHYYRYEDIQRMMSQSE